MKKLVSLLLSLLIVCFSFASCKSKAPYTILEIGGYDYISSADHNDEFSLDAKRITEFKLSNEKTIRFQNTEYTVSYDYTEKGYLFNSECERYSKQNGLDFIKLGLNKKTGRIDQYSWLDADYSKNTNLVEKSRDECLQLAKDYLASYTDDIESYKLIDERYREIPEDGAIYSLVYARMINGVQTADCASINITIYGDVIMHRFESFGEMKNAKLPSQKQMETIQSDVDQKLNSIYTTVASNYSISYALDNIIFERLADGRYALEYLYDVQLCGYDENSKPISEVTHLIVILEDS